MTKTLQVAMLHYHLRPGGVTRVMQNAVCALRRHDIRIVVLAGHPHPASEAFGNVRILDGMSYGDHGKTRDPKVLKKSFVQEAAKVLGGTPDLWHVHNHGLGKNLSFTGAVRMLAEEFPVLLQIHDFPEDGRPGVYRKLLQSLGHGRQAALAGQLYPDAPQVHYAVLNARDRQFLQRAGLDPDRLHMLPNAVQLQTRADEAPAVFDRKGRLFYYPTRSIRRKNLGEFLLWAALADRDDWFALSMAPANPEARPVYARWVRFAEALGLPVVFELGNTPGSSFVGQLLAAHAMVTTSVGEGFGLAFLEPWLVGRGLCGRKLPEITAGFAKEGVRLHGLYERVDVPLDWIGRDRFRLTIDRTLKASFAAYHRAPHDADTDKAYAAAVAGDMVDFGRLDETLQERVIRYVKEEKRRGGAMRPAWILPHPVSSQCIEDNARVTRDRFGIENYGRRLMAIYRQVVESPIRRPESLDGEELLSCFLAPERFFLLRT